MKVKEEALRSINLKVCIAFHCFCQIIILNNMDLDCNKFCIGIPSRCLSFNTHSKPVCVDNRFCTNNIDSYQFNAILIDFRSNNSQLYTSFAALLLYLSTSVSFIEMEILCSALVCSLKKLIH